MQSGTFKSAACLSKPLLCSTTQQRFRFCSPQSPSNHAPTPDRTTTTTAAACTSLVLTEDDKRYYREVREAGREALNAAAPGDFFELLGLELDAPQEDIKAAFRGLQRLVHPDIAGDSATALAVLLNSAYATLMDPTTRELYTAEVIRFRKEVGSFDGRPVSTWMGAPGEQRAIFVDETQCIGCRQCTHCAPDTFAMEDDYGRARVAAQWADDEELIREAIDMCPVDVIYYVKRKQLALLEFILKSCPREDIALMGRRRGGNMGPAPASQSPFVRAEVWLKYREEVELDLAGSVKRAQDEKLAAAIARAWLDLSPDLRVKGWPSWDAAVTHV